jgi:peptide/nickel transport system ATP-binding protein
LLTVRNLTIDFATANGTVSAVRDVSLAIDKGEVLGLVGESGSGKSVSALALLRLLPAQARIRGSIEFGGQELLRISEEEMRQLRGAGISMIFQEPMTALNPVMRVGDQVAEAVMAHGGARMLPRVRPFIRLTRAPLSAQGMDANQGHKPPLSKADAWHRAVEALRTVAIADADRRARDYPHQLSGGQRQRVMIAMAIVNRPALLIADEPTTALDVTIQAQVLEMLADLRRRFSLAMLFISHDLAVVSQVADRISVMYAGSVVETGTATQVFSAPLHPYTRGLLNSVPTLRTDRSKPLETVEGTVPSLLVAPQGCIFEPRCPSRIDPCSSAMPPLVEVSPGDFARCPVMAREVR